MLSIWLAARHWPMAATIGIPPAAAASKAIERPSRRARSKSSGPCSAIRALLAVTTSLPCSSRSIAIERAGSRPPTSSAATVIESSRETVRMSVEMRSGASGRFRGFERSRTTALSTTIDRPAWRVM